VTTRKQWSGEEKLRIVLEGLRPNANVEAVCRSHGIHATQFYEWEARALQAMKAGLESRQGSEGQHQRQEIARLWAGRLDSLTCLRAELGSRVLPGLGWVA
jgi:transposase